MRFSPVDVGKGNAHEIMRSTPPVLITKGWVAKLHTTECQPAIAPDTKKVCAGGCGVELKIFVYL